jgi:RimJ/RimL family protein N-acetyltransferase
MVLKIADEPVMNPHPIKPLVTARLGLVPMNTERDATFMLELLNEPAFIRNVANRGARTIDEAADYITSKVLPSYEQHGFGFYRVELRADGTPVGICGLIQRETLEDVDIGFAFFERYWRNGYASESAFAVLDYARADAGLKRLVAITAPHNESSMQLLRKLGFNYERTLLLPGFASETCLFACNFEPALQQQST